jgi:hypothetical protein
MLPHGRMLTHATRRGRVPRLNSLKHHSPITFGYSFRPPVLAGGVFFIGRRRRRNGTIAA